MYRSLNVLFIDLPLNFPIRMHAVIADERYVCKLKQVDLGDRAV